VLVLSLHCFGSSAVLEIVWYIVSLTLGLPEGSHVSSKCVVVCHVPSSSLLICRGNVVRPLHLGSSGGNIGCVSCYILQCIFPLVVMFSSLPIVLLLGLSVLGLLLYVVRVGEPGICVVFGTLTYEAERTLDLPTRRSRQGTSPWFSG